MDDESYGLGPGGALAALALLIRLIFWLEQNPIKGCGIGIGILLVLILLSKLVPGEDDDKSGGPQLPLI